MNPTYPISFRNVEFKLSKDDVEKLLESAESGKNFSKNTQLYFFGEALPSEVEGIMKTIRDLTLMDRGTRMHALLKQSWASVFDTPFPEGMNSKLLSRIVSHLEPETRGKFYQSSTGYKALRKLTIHSFKISRPPPIEEFERFLKTHDIERLEFSRITTAHLALIQRHCPKLIDLNISHSSSIKDEDLKPLIQSCKALRALDISYCQNINGSSLEASFSLVSLKMVGCTGITNKNLNTVFRVCRDLEDLNICHTHVDGSGFDFLPPSLKALHMIGCSMMEENLQTALLRCKTLEFLDISLCRYLDGSSFRHSPSTLLSLNIYQCFQIKAETLQPLRLRCPSLKIMGPHWPVDEKSRDL